ncbi:MAG TPA: carbohydrate ABC transporter permease [Acidilobales archaeon]|nr:carbohydrate ABC transporter permease [Acidilobales archaeon]
MKVSTIILNIVAWALVLFWALPFIGLIASSFQTFESVTKGWWTFSSLTLNNYIYVVTKGFLRHIGNSIIITIGSVIIPLIVAGMAAYAFSRLSFKLKTMLFLMIVALQVIPQQMVLVPLLKLMRLTHLYNTIMGIILVHSAFATPWILFFLKNFVDVIPRDYEDAAKVDGSSDIDVFFRIILPLMAPALGSVAAIQAIWAWNDLLFAITFLMPENWPSTAAVTTFVSRYNPNWGALTSASLLSILVPITLYISLQKYYVRGLSGGLKA